MILCWSTTRPDFRIYVLNILYVISGSDHPSISTTTGSLQLIISYMCPTFIIMIVGGSIPSYFLVTIATMFPSTSIMRCIYFVHASIYRFTFPFLSEPLNFPNRKPRSIIIGSFTTRKHAWNTLNVRSKILPKESNFAMYFGGILGNTSSLARNELRCTPPLSGPPGWLRYDCCYLRWTFEHILPLWDNPTGCSYFP